MKYLIIILIIIAFITINIGIFTLCRASKIADEALERFERERNKNKTNT